MTLTKAEELITPEILSSLVSYDPASGLFVWLHRDISFFTDGKLWSADQNMRRWNTRYAGKSALNGSKGNGYLHGPVLSSYLLAHRCAWAISTGFWPSDQIDHINGTRSDNRIVNLREVTVQENARNMRGDGKGKFGIQPYRDGKFTARIKRNGKHEYLGIFNSKDDAIAARVKAEKLAGYHENHGVRSNG